MSASAVMAKQRRTRRLTAREGRMQLVADAAIRESLAEFEDLPRMVLKERLSEFKLGMKAACDYARKMIELERLVAYRVDEWLRSNGITPDSAKDHRLEVHRLAGGVVQYVVWRVVPRHPSPPIMTHVDTFTIDREQIARQEGLL